MEKLIEIYNKINNFGNGMGMVLTKVDEGYIEYKMKVRDDHLATPKAAHGGAVAAFMDGILGVTALTISAPDNKLVATVEFKINYITPAFKGEELIGIGKIESKGKRIIVTSGEIRCKARNETVAKALGTFNAYPFEKAGINLQDYI